MTVDYRRFAQGSGLDMNKIMNAANFGMGIAQARQRSNAADAAVKSKEQWGEYIRGPMGEEDTIKFLSQNPQYVKAVSENYQNMSKVRKDGAISNLKKMRRLMMLPDKTLAKAEMDERILAATNSGDEARVQELTASKNLIDTNPETALGMINSSLAIAWGPETFAKNIAALDGDDSDTWTTLTPEQKKAQGYKAGDLVQKSSTGKVMINRAPAGDDSFKVLTSAEVARSGLDPKISWQRNINTGRTYALGKDGVSVNISTMPKNFMPDEVDRNGNVLSVKPIPGSPADIAAKAAAKKVVGRAEEKSQYANIVSEDIGRAMDLVGDTPWWNPITGVSGAIAKHVPGSAASDFDSLKTAIVSNIGFDRLFQMRQNAETGGALGNISDREVKFLQSVMGDISASQSKEQLLYNLGRLETRYGEFLEKYGALLEEHGLVSETGRLTLPPAPEVGTEVPPDLKSRSYWPLLN